MKRNIALLAVLCFAIAGIVGVAAAQDAQVAGTWTLSSEGRGGNMQNSTLTLKQDGQKLTGTLAGGRGGDAHTPAEWYDNVDGPLGIARAMTILVTAADLVGA